MQPHHWSTARVEAFSDGVFAIAITLLVLEIKIEPSEFDHLWRALGHEWPAYLAYVTSFLTIGAIWIAHHDAFTHLRYVDPVLMRLNLLLLMVVAFLPFPTALLAGAFDASDAAERAAVTVYGGTALAIELLMGGIWRYAYTHPALIEGEAPTAADRPRRSALSAAIYPVALLLGILVFPKLAAIGYLVVGIRGVLSPAGGNQLTLRGLFN